MPSTPQRAEPLLEAATDDLTARERRRPPSVQAQDSDDTLDGSEQELPYSLSNECRYFLSKGIPLGVSAAAEWGAPPLIGMMFAGHTPESATLQSAIGFGRLYFNVSILMIMLGLCSYLQSVIPGAIGAGRKDRIPMYLARSLALSMLCLLPSFLLSLCSDVVLQAVGVPPSIAAEVGVYTRLMLPNAVLILLDIHIETVFMNLGFAKCCSINSVLTGLGVDVAVTYLFVYRWRWGVRGVALAQLAVRLSRIVVFGVLIAWNGLGRTFFGEAAFRRTAAARAAAGAAGAPTPPLRCSVERGGEEAVAPPATTKRRRERLCDPKEARIFASLGAPGIGSNLSGWLIFELQILALANIHVRRSWSLPLSSRLADPPRLRRRTRSHTNRLRSRRPPPAARRPPNPLLLTRAHAAAPMLAQGIPPAALAAGAVWIQCEQCIAAVQTGWIQVVQIRTLALMGRSDPGAPRAYALMCLLGSLCVACVSVAIGVSIGPLSRLLSHDRDTQLWLRRILWVLVPHNQTRAPNRNLEPQSTTSHSGPPRPDSICRRSSRPGAPPPPTPSSRAGLACITANFLFVPLGKSLLGIGSLLVGFYAIATPAVGVVALTDAVTTSVQLKMALCVGATTIAQLPVALFGYAYNARMDWQAAGRIIKQRANSDRPATPRVAPSCAASGGGGAAGGSGHATPRSGRSPRPSFGAGAGGGGEGAINTTTCT